MEGSLCGVAAHQKEISTGRWKNHPSFSNVGIALVVGEIVEDGQLSSSRGTLVGVAVVAVIIIIVVIVFVIIIGFDGDDFIFVVVVNIIS